MAWLQFNGFANETASGWRLVPKEEQDISIDMLRDDVQVDGSIVLVRQGSHALDIRVPPASPARVAPEYQSPKKCEGGKSRCLGGIEYCCNQEAKDKCNGLWDDC